MLAEMGDTTFKLGNVLEHSYEELLTSDALLHPLEESFTLSVPMCSDCAYEHFCGADPVFHYATTRDYVAETSVRLYAQYDDLQILDRVDGIRSLCEEPFARWANRT
jgi:MoaA/NifB/PqqE/SkfB family radical SAM enzyme